MRINNVQRNDIITINRKPAFRANPKISEAAKVIKSANTNISENIINHYGLNIETAVNYTGPRSYTPAPENLPNGLTNFYRFLEVDWDTHVEKGKKNLPF